MPPASIGLVDRDDGAGNGAGRSYENASIEACSRHEDLSVQFPWVHHGDPSIQGAFPVRWDFWPNKAPAGLQRSGDGGLGVRSGIAPCWRCGGVCGSSSRARLTSDARRGVGFAIRRIRCPWECWDARHTSGDQRWPSHRHRSERRAGAPEQRRQAADGDWSDVVRCWHLVSQHNAVRRGDQRRRVLLA